MTNSIPTTLTAVAIFILIMIGLYVWDKIKYGLEDEETKRETTLDK